MENLCAGGGGTGVSLNCWNYELLPLKFYCITVCKPILKKLDDDVLYALSLSLSLLLGAAGGTGGAVTGLIYT